MKMHIIILFFLTLVIDNTVAMQSQRSLPTSSRSFRDNEKLDVIISELTKISEYSSLESLSLFHNEHVSTDFIWSLMSDRSVVTLKIFNIGFCSKFDVNCLTILGTLPQLRAISIEACPLLTDSEIMAFSRRNPRCTIRFLSPDSGKTNIYRGGVQLVRRNG